MKMEFMILGVHYHHPRKKSHKERYLDAMAKYGLPNEFAEKYYNTIKEIVDNSEGFISYDDVARKISEGFFNALILITKDIKTAALKLTLQNIMINSLKKSEQK